MTKPEDTKRCSKCGEEKAIVTFTKKARNRNGHGSICKECHNKYNREKRSEEGTISRKEYLDNLIQRWESEGRPQLTEKRCTRCNEVKSVTEFWKTKHKKDGYTIMCIKCYKRYARKCRERIRRQEKPFLKEIACKKCAITKPASDFCRNLALTTGYKQPCKECMRKRDLELHPEKIRIGDERPCKRCKKPIIVTESGTRYCNDCTRAKRNEMGRRTRRRQALALSDNYIKKLIVAKTDLSHSDIPERLVEAKRLHIQIDRTIKEGE